MGVVRAAINQEGRICGQHHHRAKLSDSLVQKLRDLHEKYGLGWRRLSAQFELTPITVKKILAYERRNCTVVAYKQICSYERSTVPSADGNSKMSSPPSESTRSPESASGAPPTGS